MNIGDEALFREILDEVMLRVQIAVAKDERCYTFEVRDLMCVKFGTDSDYYTDKLETFLKLDRIPYFRKERKITILLTEGS